jgi:hypothetical protein
MKDEALNAEQIGYTSGSDHRIKIKIQLLQ